MCSHCLGDFLAVIDTPFDYVEINPFSSCSYLVLAMRKETNTIPSLFNSSEKNINDLRRN